jgi:hypothetical protein
MEACVLNGQKIGRLAGGVDVGMPLAWGSDKNAASLPIYPGWINYIAIDT